jgi:effector-binding domain-containing protein
MAYECQVIEQATQPVLSTRTRTSVQNLPQVIGRVYGAVSQYMAELGEQPAGPPFAAYYNMDMQDLDVEAGFPVSRPLPGRGDIQASEIAGGKAATCIHVGPYSEVGPAYETLSQWIKENGYDATGVAYEMYLNDPQQTPPQELKTQIVLPLRGT